MTPSEPSEQPLRVALAAGDIATATSLVVQWYGPGILGFLTSRLGSASDGREAYAMFLEDIWQGLPNFLFRCSARAWAYTLARNAANRYASTHLRRRGRDDPLSAHPSVLQREGDARTTTDVHLRTGTKERIRELRNRLAEQDRTLLVLHVDRGLTFREVAEVLHEGPLCDGDVERETARVRKRFERLKAQLRQWAIEGGVIRPRS